MTRKQNEPTESREQELTAEVERLREDLAGAVGLRNIWHDKAKLQHAELSRLRGEHNLEREQCVREDAQQQFKKAKAEFSESSWVAGFCCACAEVLRYDGCAQSPFPGLFSSGCTPEQATKYAHPEDLRVLRQYGLIPQGIDAALKDQQP